MFALAVRNSTCLTSRELLDPFVQYCGSTRMDVPAVNVSGATEVRWQNDDSHHGPCEVWIDDHRVLHDDDCRATFTTYPARNDEAWCDKVCRLTFSWLALHEPAWQVYSKSAHICVISLTLVDTVVVQRRALQQARQKGSEVAQPGIRGNEEVISRSASALGDSFTTAARYVT
jgi:hypothetical protein